jgi:hypothetical protein
MSSADAQHTTSGVASGSKANTFLSALEEITAHSLLSAALDGTQLFEQLQYCFRY